MEHRVKFSPIPFRKRVKSMLRVDFRRMFKSRTFYVLVLCALLLPVIMLVMLSMMDGSVSVDPQTGVETVIEGPENTWQAIGALPHAPAAGGMDVLSMCNINMVFPGVAIFICLFISEDFRSGYAKNLFTVRAGKSDYVISKTLAGLTCGILMLLAYFMGALAGGAVAGLSFDLHTLSAANIVLCMLAKICLIPVFISIFVLISVAAKQRAWLALCGSLGGGMLLFMMVPALTPLNSTMMNVLLCLAGSVMFAIGLGAVSNLVLKKTSLV